MIADIPVQFECMLLLQTFQLFKNHVVMEAYGDALTSALVKNRICARFELELGLIGTIGVKFGFDRNDSSCVLRYLSPFFSISSQTSSQREAYRTPTHNYGIFQEEAQLRVEAQ